MSSADTPSSILEDNRNTLEFQQQNQHDRGIVPPNSPATSYDLSPRAAREHQFSSLNHQVAEASEPTTSHCLSLPNGLDLRALTYVGNVDENLMCPICHSPLVDPVDTECDHTFCRSCISQALSLSEHCPIDRYPLSRQATLGRSHKIVINQLDALLVKCVCCENPIPRSMLQNHVERYCKDALVKCPGKTCDHVVKRELSDKGCLHYDVTCPDCKESHQEISMANHRETSCKEREKECQHCGVKILRCKEPEHVATCPDVTASCNWAQYGCEHQAKRKELHTHVDECAFKLVGPMADMLKKEISTLQAELRVLSEKDSLQERRIRFLESGLRDSYRPLDYSDVSSQQIATIPDSSNAEPLDSASEYMLSLVEAQESRVSQLSAGMTDLEAKQTMMLFNETIPIKNELAEMRSQHQVVSMHVRWLLNFRRQENQKRFVNGGGPGPSGGNDGSGPSNDSSLPIRRLSDTTPRDIMTRL